jgi:predicted nicotinamide N-methyase
MDLWQATETLTGESLTEAPFWAIPWPAGLTVARLLFDEPCRVRGKNVLDVGVGGGVVSLTAAALSASRVVAADKDPLALLLTKIAARRQGLCVELLEADLTQKWPQGPFDLVVAADMAYERSVSPVLRQRLDQAQAQGADVLVADAGRRYFDASGLTLLRTGESWASAEIDDRPTRATTIYERRGAPRP